MPSQASIRSRYAAFPDLRQAIDRYVEPGMTVLDVGAGAYPAIERERRPPGLRYVGLDVSGEELRRAPAGSYDELVVASVLERQPDLAGRFDLIVSLQTFEHVRPLDVAITNLQSYLKPGGQFVAQFTGAFTYFSLLNRVVPAGLKHWALWKVHERHEEDIFPAFYDKCWHGALEEIFAGWSAVTITPFYTGGGYLNFSEPVFRLYLVYEDWAERRHHRNLASHYIVHAVR